MNKITIADKISNLLDISKSDAKIIMEKIIYSFEESLSKGERIEIRGFGIFKVIQKKQSIRRNPKTGEKVMALPKKVVVFKPGEELADLVNTL